MRHSIILKPFLKNGMPVFIIIPFQPLRGLPFTKSYCLIAIRLTNEQLAMETTLIKHFPAERWLIYLMSV